MQAALDITAKYCHKELEAYGSCVASNPSTWHQKCHELKVKVAQCTSTHPVIQKIRQECSKEFVAFEGCLRENQDKATSCTPHVARFLACAEAVDISVIGKSLLQWAMYLKIRIRNLSHRSNETFPIIYRLRRPAQQR